LPEVICNTSPLQYLHQIGQLELLPKLVSRITVPTAVAQELAEGRRRGLDLPILEALAWIDLRAPSSEQVVRLVET
jgi:predicted nucleic acid-binding protein